PLFRRRYDGERVCLRPGGDELACSRSALFVDEMLADGFRGRPANRAGGGNRRTVDCRTDCAPRANTSDAAILGCIYPPARVYGHAAGGVGLRVLPERDG